MNIVPIRRLLAFACVPLISIPLSVTAHAQAKLAGKICANKTTNVLTVRTRCKKTESVLSTSASLRGSNGAPGSNGAAGADGSIRIYGDGSAGPLNVTSGFVTLVESNTQFTDCSISSSAFLSVPSGTIIRCSGNFTLRGTLSVTHGTAGGVYNSSPSANVYTASLMPPHPGVGRFAAGSGELGAAGSAVKGGRQGYSASAGDAESFITFSKYGGGGGGASFTSGGSGGGSLLVLAKGQITIEGALFADGNSGNVLGTGGGGGGAGGVIFLASQTGVAVQSPGTISARGGEGGNSSASSAAGGGGAGGLVKIISPNNSVDQTVISVLGGSAGSVSTTISSTVAYGGGAGGPCIEGGGAGGDVPLGRPVTSTSPGAGLAGYVIVTTADPTSMF